jgi:hypothetical protein
MSPLAIIVCGIPGTILASFVLTIGRDHLDKSTALFFSLYMIVAEVLIAGILHFVAEKIWKRTHKVCTKADET